MKTSREFLMLAQDYDANKHNIAGSFVSEKLDGMRAIWIPTTVGIEVRQVPFANLQKDATSNAARAASGLWSRYGNPIWAPDEWIKKLPHDLILDGELWINRHCFQQTVSITKKKEGLWSEWQDIKFMVFDNPDLCSLFTQGKIHNAQWKHFVFPTIIPGWMVEGIMQGPRSIAFEDTIVKLKKYLEPNEIVQLHHQERISFMTDQAIRRLDYLLDQVLVSGGEGCMIRQPYSIWEPHRANHLLKVKPNFDSEGTVIGWEPGKGRLEGMLGSLKIKWVNPLGKQVVFQLSGFTDVERKLDAGLPIFAEGTRITFKYRELTDDGAPKEARFFRVAESLQ